MPWQNVGSLPDKVGGLPLINYEKAAALFRQILENRPEMYEIAYSLGLLLVEQKKYSHAVVYLEQAAAGLVDNTMSVVSKMITLFPENMAGMHDF